MKKPYSELVTRLFLIPRQLERLFPSDPVEIEQVIRVRESDDTALTDGAEVASLDGLRVVRAALFYYFDALDEAMTTLPDSTDLDTAYWRAMIFRRLGDIDNAKIALRAAGEHPSSNYLHSRVAEQSANMAKQLTWDPYLFVSMAEQNKYGDQESVDELVYLQKTEFEVMFDYIWRATVQLEPEEESL